MLKLINLFTNKFMAIGGVLWLLVSGFLMVYMKMYNLFRKLRWRETLNFVCLFSYFGEMGKEERGRWKRNVSELLIQDGTPMFLPKFVESNYLFIMSMFPLDGEPILDFSGFCNFLMNIHFSNTISFYLNVAMKFC